MKDIRYVKQIANAALTGHIPHELRKPLAEHVAHLLAEVVVRVGDSTPASNDSLRCHEYRLDNVFIRHTRWFGADMDEEQIDIWHDSAGRVFLCSWPPFTVHQLAAGSWMSAIPVLMF